MRWCVILLLAGFAFAQNSAQQPNHQSGWPCTGKPRAFDPTYAKISEASGGHLFLFDKSEITGMSTLAIGDMNHKQTLARAAGKTDSYIDIPFYVDSSVQSLFVVASLQCMQTMYLYDPQRGSIGDSTQGVADAWFHAGRITTVPAPAAGQWVLRLLGTGSYFVAIEAKSEETMGQPSFQNGLVSFVVSPPVPGLRARIVRASGEPLQNLNVAEDPAQASRYQAPLGAVSEPFRVQVEWTTAAGQIAVRTDPRLYDPTAPAR